MTKKVNKVKVNKPSDYSISQKVGVDNREPVKELMQQIYGDENNHDFNTMMSGLISVIQDNNLVKKVKQEVVIAPKKKKLSLKRIELKALQKEVQDLEKEVRI